LYINKERKLRSTDNKLFVFECSTSTTHSIGDKDGLIIIDVEMTGYSQKLRQFV